MPGQLMPFDEAARTVESALAQGTPVTQRELLASPRGRAALLAYVVHKQKAFGDELPGNSSLPLYQFVADNHAREWVGRHPLHESALKLVVEHWPCPTDVLANKPLVAQLADPRGLPWLRQIAEVAAGRGVIVRTSQQTGHRRPAHRPQSFDPKIDEKFVQDWRASEMSLAAFAKARGIPLAKAQRTVDRVRDRARAPRRARRAGRRPKDSRR